MKIAITGCQGIPASYGGFETLAYNLSLYLKNNHDVTVYCETKLRHEDVPSGVSRVFIPFKANGAQSIAYDVVSLFSAFRSSDIILQLGVTGGLVYPFLRPFYKSVRVITHIDGLEWARPKWNPFVKYLLRILERLSIHLSDYIIVDNQGILDYVEREYGDRYSSRCFHVSYGGIHSQNLEPPCDGLQLTDIFGVHHDLSNQPYSICVTRPVPENNTHLIVNAFKNLPPNYRLLLISNWDRSNYSQSIIDSASKYPNIIISNPIYDKSLLSLFLDSAQCYIHGHSAGGTNPMLVEAISRSVVPLSFDVPFNRYTTSNKALYWSTENDLRSLLKQLDQPQIEVIQELCSHLYETKYNWDTVNGLYARLLLDYAVHEFSFHRLVLYRLLQRLQSRLSRSKTAPYVIKHE